MFAVPSGDDPPSDEAHRGVIAPVGIADRPTDAERRASGASSLSPRHCSHANPVNLSRTSTLVRNSIRWLRSDQGLRDICDVRADGLRLDAELDESFRAEPRVTGVHR